MLKVGEGCYFGDEEGLEPQKKQYYAKVSSLNTMLFVISKNKIKLNITENDNLHRWKNMCIASKQRSLLLGDSVCKLKNVVSCIKRNGFAHDGSGGNAPVVEVPPEIKDLEAMAKADSENDAVNQKLEFQLLHSEMPDKFASYLEVKQKQLEEAQRQRQRLQSNEQGAMYMPVTQRKMMRNESLSKYLKATLTDRSLSNRLQEAKKNGKKLILKDQVPEQARINFLDSGVRRLRIAHHRMISARKPNYSLFITDASSFPDDVLSSSVAKSDRATLTNESTSEHSQHFLKIRKGITSRRTTDTAPKSQLDAVVKVSSRILVKQDRSPSLSIDTGSTFLRSSRSRPPSRDHCLIVSHPQSHKMPTVPQICLFKAPK